MKKHLLFTTFTLFMLQLTAQLSFSVVKSKWHDAYSRYHNYSGRDSELAHHVTGLEVGYREKLLVVNFQSSILYFNRDITHYDAKHYGGGSGMYSGEFITYQATMEYAYLNNRLAVGVNWSNLEKKRPVSFMFAVLGFYQIDAKLKAQETNHRRIVRNKYESGWVGGNPENPTYTNVEHPPNYAPYELATYSKHLSHLGIELTGRIIVKNVFFELFTAVANSSTNRLNYNYWSAYSDQPDSGSRWSLNLGCKLGYML